MYTHDYVHVHVSIILLYLCMTDITVCTVINPRRACAARVTVVVLCVCLSVCLSVCLRLFSHHGLRAAYERYQQI